MATCEENFNGYFKAPPNAGPDHKRDGIIDKTAGYASPDGLWFDQSDRLCTQTDVSTNALNHGDFAALDNNQMLVSDLQSCETLHFLTGPKGCEITGITTTPDGRSLLVNIQQPDETASERFKPDNTSAVSSWPANQFTSAVGGRPRSATVVITHQDGSLNGRTNMNHTNLDDIPCFLGLLDEIDGMSKEIGMEFRHFGLRVLSILVPGITLLVVALGRIG